jgi:ferredoxin hydrogenase gamma subunit
MRAYINTKDVDFEPGETILQAATRNGEFIPTLCELAAIGHAPGTCRVCLVEIRQTGDEAARVVASCTTPMTEGMSVFTRTRRVREMRRLQVELLLADHDQDCAACIRHGDCELQDVAQFVGLTQSRRFGTFPQTRSRDASSPAIVRDMGKCIRCMRCLKLCRDFQGVDALVFTGSGTDAQIGLRGETTQVQSDCVSCGQCVLVCPVGALAERDAAEQVIDYLYDPDVVTVFQFAPAVRVALGEEFGFAPGANVEGRIVAALRRLGADLVMDTNFAADLVIMEEGAELLKRIRTGGTMPMFTSCCPAWINFAEKNFPEILPHISSTRSPQQCFGSMAKTYLAQAMDIDPARMRVISIMPCTAKKDEAARPQLRQGDRPDVDAVLTTREFARLLKREGLDLGSLESSAYDNPIMSEYSGAAAIFGVTGGVMEAAVRTVYHAVTGGELGRIELGELRGFEDVRLAEVDLGPSLGPVKVAMAHGLAGARRVVEAALSGRADFHFVEVMACPGGCMDGGGQPRCKGAYQKHAQARRETLYAIDATRPVRQSHNNPQIQRIYAEYLGEPLSETSHNLLHTHYTNRRRVLRQTMTDIWREITMTTQAHSEFDAGESRRD